MTKRTLFLLLLCCVIWILTACSNGESTLSGWYLHSENGADLMITEDHGPISMSEKTRGGTLFDGLNHGDFIEITHDAIAETYPGQAGVYTCQKLSDGSFEDIPADIVADLRFMGYTFDFHSHAPAEEPLMTEVPVTGYCGNTVTEVILNGETYSFWGSDSVALTDLLLHLNYDPGQVCRCLPEFTVNTELGSGYEVNLSDAYVRCEAGQVSLTTEQVAKIREIVDKNCT